MYPKETFKHHDAQNNEIETWVGRDRLGLKGLSIGTISRIFCYSGTGNHQSSQSLF